MLNHNVIVLRAMRDHELEWRRLLPSKERLTAAVHDTFEEWLIQRRLGVLRDAGTLRIALRFRLGLLVEFLKKII